MQVPRITKITINMGVGEAVADKKVMDAAVADLAKLSGQKPLVCKSKKSIASFKLREGLAVCLLYTSRPGRWHRRQDDAHSRLEGCDLESFGQTGRPRRGQDCLLYTSRCV